jgi:hypothetical protein
MIFTLTIDTDNAAFEADELELQRVIKNVANKVAQVPGGGANGTPMAEGRAVDANGNTVGEWSLKPSIQERLEYLRGEIRAERISYSEIAELQGLVEHIDPGDVELLEWAGVPEFPDSGEDEA